MAKSPPMPFHPTSGDELDRLVDLEAFGSNPGNLRARIFVPASLKDCPALIVVLHGCTQTAAGYDTGSGWSRLADERGFMLLFPEQKRANNPNLCFNWFSPGDIGRDAGEALSIRQMIAALVRDHAVNPARIFVTGLSAGGAMTSVMLATYPEVFAGGAIIAGLPYGTARGVPQALERMTGRGLPGADTLGRLVRDASPYAGPWPTLSVWHGTGDTTVNAANAEAIVAQWISVRGIAKALCSTDLEDRTTHRTWRDADNRPVIEHFEIAGMEHGTPLRSSGPYAIGSPGPFFLDVGISSTRRIAAFWGLVDASQSSTASSVKRDDAPTLYSSLPIPRTLHPERIYQTATKPVATHGVGQIIEDALRAAGLMR